jgi:hypothetical protein
MSPKVEFWAEIVNWPPWKVTCGGVAGNCASVGGGPAGAG